MASVLTLNKDRASHLNALIEGLNRSKQKPRELIIIEMSNDLSSLPETPFPIKRFHVPSEELPLAKARNMAAEHAESKTLLFLDVDCIPASNFVQIMTHAIAQYQQIISCEVLYLPTRLPNTYKNIIDDNQLCQLGKKHEVRTFPESGYRKEPNPGLFWSLAFGLSASKFNEIGGFCEEYIGYGAEDTDFGFRAHKLGIEHWLTSETRAYHQYHPSYEPPYQHFFDIIKNASLFYSKWHKWAMAGWLAAFAKAGLIIWHSKATKIIIIKPPYTI